MRADADHRDKRLERAKKFVEGSVKKYLKEFEKDLLIKERAKTDSEGNPLPPERVYHYTTARGLKGILKNRTMWATHALYLNDPEERKHGIQLINDVLDLQDDMEHGNERSGLLRKRIISECRETLAEDPRTSALSNAGFFLSFSKKRDDLSQFRTYSNGGAGYCVGFNYERLKNAVKEVLYENESLMTPVHVVYDDYEAVVMLTSCAGFVFLELEKLVIEDEFSNDEISKTLAPLFATLLYNTSVRFKQEGYKDEAELRFMPSPWIPASSIKAIEELECVREEGGVFVRYLDFPLGAPEGYPAAIDEIVIGPKLDPTIAEAGLRSMLYQTHRRNTGILGYEKMEISPSSTRLR